MSLRGEVADLRDKVNRKIESYDHRLKQLECNHVIVPHASYDNWGSSYREMWCEKCEKHFEYLSEEAYLKAMLETNLKTCKEDRERIERSLKKLQSEEAK